MNRSFKRPEKGEYLCPRQVKKDSKEWTLLDWKNYEQFLSEDQIKDQNLWEIYLDKLETPLRETLINPKRYDHLANKLMTSSYKKKEEDTPSYLIKYGKYLHGALKTLSYREREVIEGVFWDGKTERRLAREMGIDKTVVAIYKKRAMEKIKEYILNIQDEIEQLAKREAV